MEYKTDISLLKVRKLPIFQNLDEMSNVSGFSKQLIYYYAISEKSEKYEIIKVPKKDGGTRVIYAPKYALKMLQRWVLVNILYKVECSSNAFAFKKSEGSPLKKNAEFHENKLFLFEMDFKDFFPSISRQRVFYLFNNLGYNISISNWLANICTYKEILPQGSVTAPYLSNLICLSLDKRISKYCSKRDILYSRYADDITFSGDDKNKLKMIYGMIKRIALDEGFTINDKKTRFIGKGSKKIVTGITLSEFGVKAPREYKNKVRWMIHRSLISGDYSNNNIIKGYISYITSIEPNYTAKIKHYIESLQREDILFLNSTVELFNQNKIFNEIEDFKTFEISQDEEDDYADMAYERFEFLKSRGLNIPEEIKFTDNHDEERGLDIPFI